MQNTKYVPTALVQDVADPSDTPIRRAVTITLAANAAAVGDISCPGGYYLHAVYPQLDTDVPGGAWPKGASVFMESVLMQGSEVDATLYRHPLMGGSRWPTSVPRVMTQSTQKLRTTITAGTTDENGNSLTGAKVKVVAEWRAAKPASCHLVQREATDFPGTVRHIALTQPAAGADYASKSVPNKVEWRVLSWNGQLVTGALGTARNVQFEVISAGGPDVDAITQGPNHAASTTQYYSAYRGFASLPQSLGSLTFMNVFDRWFTSAVSSAQLKWVTNNIQAADQWGAGMLEVEERVQP
jgi:hypothetical protein